MRRLRGQRMIVPQRTIAKGLDMAWVIYPLAAAILLYGALGLVCVSALVGFGSHRT